MKTVNLECRLCSSRTRSDFLSLMPALREYILKQAAELPQKDGQHTHDMLIEQCQPIADDDEKCMAIVGCIATEKPPFQTFWWYAEATIEAHKAAVVAQEKQSGTAEYKAKSTIALIGSALNTYLTGMKVYDAAKYAYSKPVEQNRLGAYWDRVKI